MTRSCPRCGRRYLRPPALSRTDNQTDICGLCGYYESLEAAIGKLTPQSDWPLWLRRFKDGEIGMLGSPFHEYCELSEEDAEWYEEEKRRRQ